MFTMVVRDHMSTPVITASAVNTVAAALKTMRDHSLHHLAVVDERRKLIGIVTRRDLGGRPAADPVSVHMTRTPYVTSPDTPLVQAATQMRDLHVGALPVLDRGELVGIITESDILDDFLELLGTRRPGTRMIVPLVTVVRDIPELLAAVARSGVSVTGLTTLANGHRVWAILNVNTIEPQRLIGALKDAGFSPAQVNILTTAA